MVAGNLSNAFYRLLVTGYYFSECFILSSSFSYDLYEYVQILQKIVPPQQHSFEESLQIYVNHGNI